MTACTGNFSDIAKATLRPRIMTRWYLAVIVS